MTGTAKAIGEQAVLKVLKEGEEHGVKEYGDALAGIQDHSAEVLVEELLPRQQSHITSIDRFLH